MMGAMTDFDVVTFARILERLEPHPPITTAQARTHEVPSRWWESERQHMVRWFEGQNTLGAGAYTRGTPNRSAGTTYNRLMNFISVLWIAEALGAPREDVARAAELASAEPNYRRRPAIVRGVFPWETIHQLAVGREQPLAKRMLRMPHRVSRGRS